VSAVIVIGVDGGGTKTRTIVADADGNWLADVVGDASAVRPGEAARSAEVIASTVTDALESAGLSGVRPRAICVGVAGVGREPERESLREALGSLDLAEELSIQPDFVVALDDAFGDGPGILLISGTGSVALGRSPTGTTARVGGWGPVCGDEGGGGWIGRKVLSIVTASADGREPDTALIGAVLTAAEVDEVQGLVQWAATAPPAQLATLAPIVMRVADSGDQRANSLVTLAVEELALHIRALARQLFGDERAAIPLALTGGMLSRGTTLRKRLEHRLRSAVPGAQLRVDDVVPVRGAVKGALKLIEREVAEIRDRG
jgi:glucosamine kinase